MDMQYLRTLGVQLEAGGPLVIRRKGAHIGSLPVGGPSASSAAAAATKTRPAAAAATKSRPAPPASSCCLAHAAASSGGGKFAPGKIEREGHPPWCLPVSGHDVGLRAFNSLTGEKEQFVPLEGRKVRWYMCGPTVYDVAHMGHARAYLTFDIIRRIMRDFFGYDLSYQINITDIDDKIIMRSRQNKLFADFCKDAEAMDDATLKQQVDAAVEFAEKKLLAKEPQKPPADAPEKDKQEYEKLTQEHLLKLSQHKQLQERVNAAASGTRSALIEAAREPLMAKLDKERGHTVSDHSIFYDHARKFEDEYFADMDELGVERPDVVTRITDYMDGRVQKFIEKLVELGVAYNSSGSVYFSIDDFNKQGYTYRKLVPAATVSAAEMAEGEGALATEDAEKKNPNDFALWKKSKPGEPAWESKWGPGRPGWHIECSVMATDIQGEFLDIHSGGEDLKFPHHDNEMAQSEAYLCRGQWVNYFWHAGHLHIEGLKMSKSLKNFITIRQALQMHSAQQLRLMFLMQPWDKGMNYSDQSIDMAKEIERKVKHVFGCLRFFSRHPHGQGQPGDREKNLAASIATCKETVDAALRDNFNTGKVVDSISRLLSECYPFFDALPDAPLKPVSDAKDFVQGVFSKLGLEVVSVPANAAALEPVLDAFAGVRNDVRKLAREGASAQLAQEAAERARPSVAAARASGLEACADAFEAFLNDLASFVPTEQPLSKFLKRCDQVRDQDFVSLGVRLEDRNTGLGFVWMFEDPAVLRREMQEQAEKAAAAGQAKLQGRLTQKEQELKTATKAAVKPVDLFRDGTYSEFDENGIPTKLASGEELSNKKKKDIAKEHAKQQKDFDKLVKQAGASGVDAFIGKLRKEVEDLQAQLGAQ